MDENIQHCCRICLDVESKLVSILEDSLIHLQVKSCLPITIVSSDNLPKSICENCVTQLNDFYNFQLNARCSQDWLESSLQKTKSCPETKLVVQPLPDSEYNSDSLLEFLNNTANIEEYLNNLGKEDIPSIVNMLDKTETSDIKCKLPTKLPSPKKKEFSKTQTLNMDIDVLDSDMEIVKELLMKEGEPKKQIKTIDKFFTCYGCKLKCNTIQKLSQHLSICDIALRTCIHCNLLFNSKLKMCQHLWSHNTDSHISTEKHDKHIPEVTKYQKDYVASMGYVYSCKQCGDTFNNRFQLFKHAKDHTLKTDEKICDICGHLFRGNDVLLKHRKEEHEKPEKFLYRCKICSFTSPDRKQIYSHVIRHTQSKPPNRHLCESCGQSFATQATLIRHSHQHTSEFYKCNICNRKFANKTLRDEHKLVHIEVVICEKCGRNISILELDTHPCV